MKGRSSIRNKVIIIIATFTVACAWFLLEVPRIWPSFFVIISSDLQFFISSIDFYVPGHSVFNVTQIPLNRRFTNRSSSISYNITRRSVCSSPGNPGTVRLEVSSMFGRIWRWTAGCHFFVTGPKLHAMEETKKAFETTEEILQTALAIKPKPEGMYGLVTSVCAIHDSNVHV